MIRDETHRTAVTYHRKRREMRDFTSELTAIPGVGEKRKNRLLRNLGSISKRLRGHSRRALALRRPQDRRGYLRALPTPARARRASTEPDAAEAVVVVTPTGEVAGLHHPDDPTVMTDETIADEHIETRLVDPEGDAEDLQPVRSVDHEGEVATAPQVNAQARRALHQPARN